VSLLSIGYLQAVLDNSVYGGLNDPTNALVGHWPMNETSGTTMIGYGPTGTTPTYLKGTYRNVGSQTFLGQSTLMPGLSDTAVSFTGDTSTSGAYVSNSTAMNVFNSNYPVFNAWVSCTQIPKPYFFQSATGTLSTSGGVSTLALTSSNASTIQGYMNTYISQYNSGDNSSYIQVVGNGIPFATSVSATSLSGSTLYLTLTNVATLSGTTSVDISVSDNSQSFGYVMWKPNDFSFQVNNWISNIQVVNSYFGYLNTSNSDALSLNGPYMLTCQVKYGADSLGQIGFICDFWVNGVYIGENIVAPAFLGTISSSNLYFGISPVPQNKYGSRALYQNVMQHATLSATQYGLSTWALQNLYVLGTQGTLYYDSSNANYRYPAVLSSGSYSNMPSNVNVYPWETTIAPANPNRKSITLINDSPGYIMLGLCYTDYTQTNTSSSLLSLNRPNYEPGKVLARFNLNGIVLEPRGGTWSSDYYQGPISAVTDLWSGYWNLTALEDV